MLLLPIATCVIEREKERDQACDTYIERALSPTFAPCSPLLVSYSWFHLSHPRGTERATQEKVAAEEKKHLKREKVRKHAEHQRCGTTSLDDDDDEDAEDEDEELVVLWSILDIF